MGYLVIGVGKATVQLLLHCIQSVQEGGFRKSEEVLRSRGRDEGGIPGESSRSLKNRHQRSEVGP